MMLSRLGHLGLMDHDESPVLDALADYHRRDYATFCPPGHKQGRGAGQGLCRREP